MAHLDGVIGDLLKATEFVSMVTQGPNGPHLVGNWGDYIRKLGWEADTILLPAGRYKETEANLVRDGGRMWLMVASRQVQGTRTPGQGAVIEGKAHIEAEGPRFEKVKANFPWARGALVIAVTGTKTQL
ncbi:MAG: hypothetical protein IT565_10485 [Rhodospirillales bacterium]|nr:hypothetical protein [Rhodospirillales bacterium]